MTTVSPPMRRVPDYSSVSARESLENLRRRQQQQQSLVARGGTTLTDLQEGAYDTIDYDKIRVGSSSETCRVMLSHLRGVM